MALLEAIQVTKDFGGLRALNGVDLSVEEGEIFSLIGPNGAGKTTMFNLVTGIFFPTRGSIVFKGIDLTKPAPVPLFPVMKRPRRPFQITRLGIGRTFQNIRLFANMTALENVMVGIDAHSRTGAGGAMLRTPAERSEGRRTSKRAREPLDFVGSLRYGHDRAKNLGYGDQRRLE